MPALIKALVALLFSTLVLAEQRTIRIAVDDWPPYQDQNAQYLGSIHRIISEAFAHEGISVSYGFHPWARSLDLAKSGDWDAAALSQWSEEREKYFYYSVPVMTSEKVFFHLTSKEFNWLDYSDLNSNRIAITLGYSYGKKFDELISNNKLETIKNVRNEQNIKMLINKRVDLFAFEKRAGEYLISSKFPKFSQYIAFHPKPIQVTNYHLIFSKKNKVNEAYLKAFNRGFEWLKAQGKVDQYLTDGLMGKYQ